MSTTKAKKNPDRRGTPDITVLPEHVRQQINIRVVGCTPEVAHTTRQDITTKFHAMVKTVSLNWFVETAIFDGPSASLYSMDDLFTKEVLKHKDDLNAMYRAYVQWCAKVIDQVSDCVHLDEFRDSFDQVQVLVLQKGIPCSSAEHGVIDRRIRKLFPDKVQDMIRVNPLGMMGKAIAAHHFRGWSACLIVVDDSLIQNNERLPPSANSSLQSVALQCHLDSKYLVMPMSVVSQIISDKVLRK